MTAEIKVLIEGYVKKIDEKEYATSSVILIKDKSLNIIVDPGMNRKLLLDSLANENLKTSDINFVILTHSHSDHSLLAGIFENAKVLDNTEVYSWDGEIGSHKKTISNNIEFILTPGHAPFHCSIKVKTKDLGNVVIAGDIFYWSEEQEQKTNYYDLINLKDPHVKDEVKLLNSRKKILEVADYIIPGHGKMFKVKK